MQVSAAGQAYNVLYKEADQLNGWMNPIAGTPAPFPGRIGIADDPPRMIELTSSEETRPPIDHLPPSGPMGSSGG